MSESTATKSNVYLEDMALAIGGSGAAETGTRRTSTGGSIILTKIDASHLNFRSVSGTPENLIDGSGDLNLTVDDLTAGGTVILSNMSIAGFVKNTAAGVLSGGNNIVDSADDLPAGISAAKIADGSVNNTEFQYLNGVTSAIQTQLNAKVTATQADQEAGTEATKYVTPAIQKYHPSAAKAWAIVTGKATPALAASYNIGSVDDNAAGKFTLHFTMSFSSVNYAMASMGCIASNNYASTPALLQSTPPAAASCYVETRQGDNANADTEYWSVVFYGDQ